MIYLYCTALYTVFYNLENFYFLIYTYLVTICLIPSDDDDDGDDDDNVSYLIFSFYPAI